MPLEFGTDQSIRFFPLGVSDSLSWRQSQEIRRNKSVAVSNVFDLGQVETKSCPVDSWIYPDILHWWIKSRITLV